MKFTKFMKGGLAAVMAMSLAACESTGTASTGSTTAASEYEGKGDVTSYTLGTFGPTTGDYAVYGLAVTQAVQLAVDAYNDANGTNIKVDAQDTKGDPNQALNVYSKYKEDGVTAIIGGTVSGESTAVAQKSSDTMMPILSPSATAADFTDLAGENVFRACYTDPQQAAKAADKAAELGYKTAAILSNNDDDYSKGLTKAFTAEFETKGGKVVASEVFATADADFSTQLDKILAAEPEVLFVPNYYEKDVLVAKQARAKGFEGQLLGCDGWDGVLESAGKDTSALEGAIFINQYSPDMESVQEIMAAYEAKFGQPINSFGINAYDSATLMMEAIAEAGSLKAADINKVIANKEYQGILGKLSFDDNGDPIKDSIFVTIKDGAYVTFEG